MDNNKKILSDIQKMEGILLEFNDGTVKDKVLETLNQLRSHLFTPNQSNATIKEIFRPIEDKAIDYANELNANLTSRVELLISSVLYLLKLENLLLVENSISDGFVAENLYNYKMNQFKNDKMELLHISFVHNSKYLLCQLNGNELIILYDSHIVNDCNGNPKLQNIRVLQSTMKNHLNGPQKSNVLFHNIQPNTPSKSIFSSNENSPSLDHGYQNDPYCSTPFQPQIFTPIIGSDDLNPFSRTGRGNLFSPDQFKQPIVMPKGVPPGALFDPFDPLLLKKPKVFDPDNDHLKINKDDSHRNDMFI